MKKAFYVKVCQDNNNNNNFNNNNINLVLNQIVYE